MDWVPVAGLVITVLICAVPCLVSVNFESPTLNELSLISTSCYFTAEPL